MKEVVVTIVGTDTRTGQVMCRDAVGNEFEIDGSIRRKGSGFPLPKEQWIIRRVGNSWVPEYHIGQHPVPTITGSRDGLHPVSAQMLDALRRLGLVYDTTAGPLIPYWDDTNDPPAPPDPTDPPAPDDEEPGTDNPPEDPGPKANHPPEKPDDPTPDGWHPLYLMSMNIAHGLGVARFRHDLLKATHSKAQVIGICEMSGHHERAPILAALDGWGVHYPAEGGECIIWRTNVFDRLDDGGFEGSAGTGDGNPSRHTAWVKLRHKATGRVVFFYDSHLAAWIEQGGHPRQSNRYHDAKVRLPGAYDHIQRLKNHMADSAKAASGEALVFSTGDFNIDYFNDKRVRFPKFLFAQMHDIGGHCSYEKQVPGASTFPGGRWLDHMWVLRPHERGVRWEQNWVLVDHGADRFYTDHRPLLVKALIRGHR